MLPFVHHTASVNGVRLHYVIGGQGEPLVLLHGFPQTWYSWHKVMPALAERYTVIAPDLRGYGDSSKPLMSMSVLSRPLGQCVQFSSLIGQFFKM